MKNIFTINILLIFILLLTTPVYTAAFQDATIAAQIKAAGAAVSQTACTELTQNTCGGSTSSCEWKDNKCQPKETSTPISCIDITFQDVCQKTANCSWSTNTKSCSSNTLQRTDLSKIGKTSYNYNAAVEIPCSNKIAGGTCPTDWKSSFVSYITRLYQFSLMISGLVALGVIIYGAVLYTLSAGNIASKEEGKDWMKGAIYGLALLFGAYLILYTINPDLIRLSDIEFTPEEQVTLTDPTANKIWVSEDGSGNSPTSSGGAGSILGCAVSTSGGLIGAGAAINDGTVAGTGSGTTCTQCLEGNELKDNTCSCKTNYTRKSNGVCCGTNTLLFRGECTSCDSFKQLTLSELETIIDGAVEEGTFTDDFDTVLIMCDIEEEE